MILALFLFRLAIIHAPALALARDRPSRVHPTALRPSARTILDWFAERGWSPRAHQIELLARAQAGSSVLLIAPTGAGKTLAGFLPSLMDLATRPKRKPGEAYRGVHTLYISPLKALAVDIERNLGRPVADMGLPISMETRTGDTPHTSGSARSRPARYTADDAGATGAADRIVRCQAFLHGPSLHRARRIALTGHVEARPSAVAGVWRGCAAMSRPCRRLAFPRQSLCRWAAAVAGAAGSSPLRGEERKGGVCGHLRRRAVLERALTDDDPDVQPASRDTSPSRGGARRPDHRNRRGSRRKSRCSNSQERVPWAGHPSRYAIPEIYRRDQAAQDDAALREHAQPGGDAVSGALAGQRGVAANRLASRFAGCQPAAARREGDGEQQPARHRRHLHAGPRDRLGRRRSGGACRRAERRQPVGAADWPCQPPHGRA